MSEKEEKLFEVGDIWMFHDNGTNNPHTYCSIREVIEVDPYLRVITLGKPEQSKEESFARVMLARIKIKHRLLNT